MPVGALPQGRPERFLEGEEVDSVTMPDTRTRQVAACLDEARTLLADLAEDGLKSNNLDAARCSINVTLKYVDILEAELSGELSDL